MDGRAVEVEGPESCEAEWPNVGTVEAKVQITLRPNGRMLEHLRPWKAGHLEVVLRIAQKGYVFCIWNYVSGRVMGIGSAADEGDDVAAEEHRGVTDSFVTTADCGNAVEGLMEERSEEDVKSSVTEKLSSVWRFIHSLTLSC
ncbi:hypothetical protein LR48_Vigan02g144100 [Vigna angularis]|uniref:Uncharacterized protein n=1 Tax=Phaseolus angularis TaxID=3914 RepID=A0A0L9TXQ8_PHAAN|nr:hypothetical protein LR48_Vigan02g144100 [Vigna angularis]